MSSMIDSNGMTCVHGVNPGEIRGQPTPPYLVGTRPMPSIIDLDDMT
jgi:hypothetical protein